MKKFKKIALSLIFAIFIILIGINTNVYASGNELKNTTRAYFCTQITKGYGNGDCILLENYDSEGNKIYGLIDAGRKITKKDADENSSTVVKEFLRDHGVTKLEFLVITHNHGDHNGDVLTVLDNFEVNRIYIKEFDEKNVTDGQNQTIYEDMIERAVAKNIKVIGVNYLTLTSSTISPSRSQDFINNTRNAKKDLFESFDEKNTIFNFGSSKIQIFNWELFNSAGEQLFVSENNGGQYVTSNGKVSTREIVPNENNHSIGLLVTQGDKKAFFSGDINNLDKNEEIGRIGDEDRLKDKIGKVDFLKLGHHGYKYSNTEDYINVLKPKYVAITNDEGGAYKDIAKWLEDNKTNYLYTTVDEYSISATITNYDVYLGFETTGTFKNVNGKILYVPDREEYKNSNYKSSTYKIEYQEKNFEASSWHQLKEIIESNKNEIVKLDRNMCTLNKLNISLKTGGNWTADDSITIEKQQNISLETTQQIKILRGTELVNKPLFESEGTLSIGKENMQGAITLDGNKANVASLATLLKLNGGIFSLYNNVTLCNNMNKTIGRTKSGTTQSYTSFGSAIYCDNATINMYGGNITNNSQDIEYTLTLPKEINNYYQFGSYGAGIYMTHGSVLNMTGGTISNNEAQNHSIVKTNESYTNAYTPRGVSQNCSGVGLYSESNSEVNLLGGAIKQNSANNNSSITLSTATEEGKKTNIYSTTNGIYGVGIYINSSKIKISNGFEISSNNAILNSKIKLEKNTSINNSGSSAVRGFQAYITNSDVTINGANIVGGEYSNNAEITNNGSIGVNGTGSISKTDFGGGLAIVSNSTFRISNLNISKCKSIQGGGIYINNNTNGTISKSNITENEAQIGGGIYIANNTCDLKLGNVKITNNKANGGSGGGIYSNGNLTISGDNTSISNNTATTNGGGLMLKTKAILNSGDISKNTAEKDGNDVYPTENLITDSSTDYKGFYVDIKQHTMSSPPVYVSYTITAYDSKYGIDETSLRYVWSPKTEVTKEEITEEFRNGQVIESPRNATGKQRLYIYVENLAGKGMIAKSGETDFDDYPGGTYIIIKGDVNQNNQIDIGDILLLLRHISQENSSDIETKHPDWKLSQEKIKIGDVNKNSQIDIGDILKLKRYIAAKNSEKVASQHPDWLNL